MDTDYPFRELPTGSASHRNLFQDLNALRCVDLRGGYDRDRPVLVSYLPPSWNRV
jgi:hypothetical protein